MTAAPLPDDHSCWPKDPFELLGVEQACDERTLKRAYSALVKRFKPEHHPEEFRKIREAYETAQRSIQFRVLYGDFDRSDSEPEDKGSVEDPATKATGRSSVTVDPPAPRPWEMAVTGDHAGAFAKLMEMLRRDPGDEDAAVQLYWLRRLFPQLAPERGAVDFLLVFLRKQGIQGRAGHLYLQSLTPHSPEVRKESFWKLATHRGSRSQLDRILRLRWQSLLQMGDVAQIRRDLKELEESSLDDVSGWLRFHGLALELAAHHPSSSVDELIDDCRQFFDSQAAHGLQLGWLFDQADQHLALSEQIRPLIDPLREQIGEQAGPVRTLLNTLFQLRRDPQDKRAVRLLKMITAWTEQPGQALAQLDQLIQLSPLLSSEMTQEISNLWYEDNEQCVLLDGYELKDILRSDKELCQSYMAPLMSYDALRQRIMQFCLDHVADFDSVVRALAEIGRETSRSESICDSRLQRDQPLRSLIRAHLVCWC